MGRKPNGNGNLVSRLLRMAEEGDEGADWRELALSLKDQEGKDIIERSEASLRVAKAMRAAGVLIASEAFFSVAYPIISIAEHRIFIGDGALSNVSKQIEEVQKAHGLKDDEYWRLGEGPEEYQRLSEEYDRITDEITAATFDEYGETELGTMYRYDRSRFDRLYEEGRLQFFPGPPPHNITDI